MLSQNIESVERVIAYASRTLNKSEKRYCVNRKELLALVNFVKPFRHYPYGKKFLVRTDHGSLRWLMNFKNPEGQVARWLELLSSYEMQIEYRPGRLHKNADALSRRSCKQCGRDCFVLEKESKHTVSYMEPKAAEEIDDLKTAQEKDNDMVRVKQWLQQGLRPDRTDI